MLSRRTRYLCVATKATPQISLACIGVMNYPWIFKGSTMHPIHDADVMLLLAVTRSSKRRPAALEEIIAALEMIQSPSPILSEAKLMDACKRLSRNGLIMENAGGLTLTADGQKVLASIPAKVKTLESPLESLFKLKEKLAAYTPSNDAHAAVVLHAEQLTAAIKAHQIASKQAGQNLLVPKPKPKEPEAKRPGQWSKTVQPRASQSKRGKA